jgi:hypothetical protein
VYSPATKSKAGIQLNSDLVIKGFKKVYGITAYVNCLVNALNMPDVVRFKLKPGILAVLSDLVVEEMKEYAGKPASKLF